MRLLASPRARRVADDRLMIIAGTAAMTAFVLFGGGTAMGLVHVSLGLLGSVGAAALFLVVLTYAHLDAPGGA